ncbi:MAG: hypothetical protein KC502_12465 [Myxococcales bacterium]|nr:hypothetical protein [Myxococcales bacterium]
MIYRCSLIVVVPVCVLLLSAHAASAEEVDFSGSNLDFFQGPLANDGRVTGLGGAYVSVAEGVAGHLVNPAAFTVRPFTFANEWFDWDVGFSVLTGVGADNDLDMSGNGSIGDETTAGQFGLNLKFGRFGIGVHTVNQQHTLSVGQSPDGKDLNWTVAQAYGGIGLGWAFMDQQWSVGVLIGIATAKISSPNPDAPLADFSTGLHPSTFGVLYSPRSQPLRVGLTFRLPQRMVQEDAMRVGKLGPLSLPESVQMPGQFAIGASWQFGERQRNVRPSYGRKKMPPGSVPNPDLRRQYTLVSADLVIDGNVNNGIGARSYLDNVHQTSGADTVVSVRFGAESEVLANRLQIRTGSYFEPNRFSGPAGRMHWTGGADVRVTALWDWRINFVFDVASGYKNIAFGLGLWH